MKPAKIKIDTVEARYSAGLKSAMHLIITNYGDITK